MKLMAKTDACTAQFYCGMKKYSSALIMYTKHAIYFFYFFLSIGKGRDFYSHVGKELVWRLCDSFEFEDDVIGVIGVLVFDDIV